MNVNININNNDIYDIICTEWVKRRLRLTIV